MTVTHALAIGREAGAELTPGVSSIPVDNLTRDYAGTPADWWRELASGLAGRRQVRVYRPAGDGTGGGYEVVRALSGRVPRQPAALLLYDDAGQAPSMALDFDPMHAGAGRAESRCGGRGGVVGVAWARGRWWTGPRGAAGTCGCLSPRRRPWTSVSAGQDPCTAPVAVAGHLDGGNIGGRLFDGAGLGVPAGPGRRAPPARDTVRGRPGGGAVPVAPAAAGAGRRPRCAAYGPLQAEEVEPVDGGRCRPT